MSKQKTTTRTAPAFRHRDRLLCPTCAQDALPSPAGAPIPTAEALSRTCAECGATLIDGDHWSLYHEALDAIAAEADTVETLIALLNHYYRPQGADAFHPGGADRNLWAVLRWERTDWTTAWSKASYWYAMRDSRGNTFTYTEGDIDRGSRP